MEAMKGRMKYCRENEFKTSYERLSRNVNARTQYETLCLLEHLNVDMESDHIASTTIDRKTLEDELEVLAEDFATRAEYLSHLFGVSKESFIGYTDDDFHTD